ncbi:unnamed protein product [Ixodes persulcatus]
MKFTFLVLLAAVACPWATEGSDQESDCPARCVCEHNHTRVSCTHAQLTVFPNSLPGHLHFLNISFNDVKSIPLLHEKKLTTLVLCHNAIDVILRGTFNRLNDLHTLDFSHNRLSSLDADDLDGLESLQFLSLEGNSLRNLAPYAFHRTPNLKVLRLSNNPLKFIDATWFRNLDVLESLEVRSIDAHSITNNAFSLATRLESIDLSDNDFVDIPRGLGSARNLKILRMDQNPLVKLDSSSMSGVRRLRELYLSQMPQLEVIEDGSFWYMKALRVVEISGNPLLKVVSASAFQWSTSPILRVVLANNSLSTLPDGFAEWCGKGKLDLRGNPWSCNCETSWIKRCRSTEGLMCSSPPRLAGRSLDEVDDSEMTCPLSRTLLLQFKDSANNKIVLAGVGACALVVSLVAGMYLWRERNTFWTKGDRYGSVYYVHVNHKSDAS